MASTYSTNLRLELIGTGEQQGTWGTTTNTNLGTLLEQAIGGYASVTVTDGADTTLTTANGATDQARNMTINLTGTLTATRNVICPAIQKIYIVKNATSGGFAVTFKVSGQTGVSIPNGSVYILYVDGVDARLAGGTMMAQNSSNVSITGGSITGITDLAIADGGTGASTAQAANANLFGFTTTATAAGTTVLSNTSTQYQVFTGTSTQTITLPVTTTLVQGWTFHICNNSTGNLTVNSSGGNLVITVIPGTSAMVTCILASGTTAASWEAGYTDFAAVTGTGSVVLATSPTLVTPALGTPASGTLTNCTSIPIAQATGLLPIANGGTNASSASSAATNLGLGTGDNVIHAGVLSNANGIGYTTGSGGAVTQATSKSTGVTLNKTNGQITMNAAALGSGAIANFTFTNSTIAATDVVHVAVNQSGVTIASNYRVFAYPTTGNCIISLTNQSAGSLSEAVVINFAVIKAVTA